MNPIPLSSPDGLIYAYACGRCHHVSAGSTMMYKGGITGPIDRLVEGSLYSADQCCTCYKCNQPTNLDSFSLYCEACTRIDQFFNQVWANLGCAILHGLDTQEKYSKFYSDDVE